LALVPELVDRPALTNAIALNATMFNSATVVGPAVAGLTYASLGPAWCFMLNGISFLAILMGLRLMQLAPFTPAPSQGSAWREIIEGLRYVLSHRVIRLLVLNAGIVSLFGVGFITLIPAWAVEVLHGDATTTGYLYSARGLGALFGSLMVAWLGRAQMKGRILTIGTLALPLGLILFAGTHQQAISLVILLGVGWAFISVMNMSNALIQKHVPDHLRGRVMGIYTMSFFGLMPLGALLNGNLAAWIGEPVTITANGVVLLGFAVLLYWRAPVMRAEQ
jgi:MFS family permease